MGMAGLLASCGGLSSGGDLYVSPSSVRLDSNYTVSGLAFRGGTYSGPVICDDRTTDLVFGFDYSGDLDRVSARLEGASGASRPDLNVYRVENQRGRHVDVYFYSPAGSVPLSKPGGISAKSIVVNPLVSGATRVVVTAYSPLGATDPLRSNYVPVIDNCL